MEIKTFNCVRDIEKYLEEGDFEIKAGIIGKWANSGETVEVVGIFVPTGRYQQMFPRQCIRWKSGNGKGLFGRGIAGYTGVPISNDRMKNLKIVK